MRTNREKMKKLWRNFFSQKDVKECWSTLHIISFSFSLFSFSPSFNIPFSFSLSFSRLVLPICLNLCNTLSLSPPFSAPFSWPLVHNLDFPRTVYTSGFVCASFRIHPLRLRYTLWIKGSLTVSELGCGMQQPGQPEGTMPTRQEHTDSSRSTVSRYIIKEYVSQQLVGWQSFLVNIGRVSLP